MAQALKIGVWNANGLPHHRDELVTFINTNEIDIMLISETHFTNKNYIKIPRYTSYNTNHPSGRAHGGAAVIIKSSIKHYELNKYEEESIQATCIVVEDWLGPLTIASVYCPPRHTISQLQFNDFYNSLGNRFIAGGDYNAKHQYWGSRLNNTRGKNLYYTIAANNYSCISTGSPTYWPTDPNKIPDVIDFCVAKGINPNGIVTESKLDLSSDHSPFVVMISTQPVARLPKPTLCNSRTDWNNFKNKLEHMRTDVPLKSENDINEAVEILVREIQTAAWQSTPELIIKDRVMKVPRPIQQKIKQKRHLRRLWQNSRQPSDKKRLNAASRELKCILKNHRNETLQCQLSELTPNSDTNYSLWKITKSTGRPTKTIPPIRDVNGAWARSDKEKATVFSEYLSHVFKPNSADSGPQTKTHEAIINNYLSSPCQMALPIMKITKYEVRSVIKNRTSPKKAPGYDLITGLVLKEIPDRTLRFITMIFNAILSTDFYPAQWKVANVIVLLKPNKPPVDTKSYRPISLLPILSKVFEKVLLKRLYPVIHENKLVPDHQFGFRREHGTIEQVHRVTDIIRSALEEKKYCSAAFLDVSQAFDKVWHPGLLYKLKRTLPHTFYQIFKSYLSDRFFTVKFGEEQSHLLPVLAGVPQGSVLGPLLYLLFTADLPLYSKTHTSTIADDTTILSRDVNPITASKLLQDHVHLIEAWL